MLRWHLYEQKQRRREWGGAEMKWGKEEEERREEKLHLGYKINEDLNSFLNKKESKVQG